jgi:hypothetical protein
MPFGHEPVGWEAAVKRARGDPVEIREIAASDCAQTIEIEVGVARLKRIEGPFDKSNTAAECFFALEELEVAAHAAVTIAGSDSSHVGMQERSAVANAGQRKGVADEPVTVESAKCLSAGVCGDHEQCCGLDFKISFAPNLTLECHASMKLFERFAATDEY